MPLFQVIDEAPGTLSDSGAPPPRQTGRRDGPPRNWPATLCLSPRWPTARTAAVTYVSISQAQPSQPGTGAESPIPGFPDFSFLDVIAALLLMLALMRRLEIKSVNQADFPHVTSDDFQHWRRVALRPHRIAALACLGKIAFGQAWLALLFGRVPHVATFAFNFAVVAAWIITLVLCWKWTSDARGLRERLGLFLPRPGPR